MPNIVVTIPAHNEEPTLGGVLRGVRRYIPEAVVQVVCNACEDKTELVAREHKTHVHRTPIGGLANAFRLEMEKALELDPEVIVHIDADGQYEPAEIASLLKAVKEGYDLVLGHRLHHRPAGMRKHKYLLNKLGALGYSTLLAHWIPDMTTGFRSFTPAVARLPVVSTYTYTQEQVWRAVREGYRIKSVPVTFYPRTSGKSRLIGSVTGYLSRSAQDFARFAWS